MQEKDIRRRDSFVIFLIFLLGVIVLSLFTREILPAKFFNDNYFIRQSMSGALTMDKLYERTAHFYLLIGMHPGDEYHIEQLFGIFLYLVFALQVLRRDQTFFIRVPFIWIWGIWSLLFVAYFTQMGKDQLAFIIVGLIPFFFQTSKKQFVVVTTISIIIYGIVLRTYWLLALGIAVVLYFSKKKKVFWSIEIIGIIFIVIALYTMISGEPVMNIRDAVNLGRIDSVDASSLIPSLVANDNLVNQVINYVYALLILIVPIKLTAVSQLVYYFWLYSIVGISIKSKLASGRNVPFQLVFFISFLITQAIFEPDLGSAMRHQAVLMPMILWTFTDGNKQEALKGGDL